MSNMLETPNVLDPEAEELARWLQESGRRKINRAWLQAVTSAPATAPTTAPAVAPVRTEWITRPALLTLLALLGLSSFVYEYADVNLRILSLPAIVVFVAR
jgi:hypothetical protein